jgi:alkanesulfonate monooxygenase SsuD/methylene tetrahydromethanopterin reductase-like flavin-dependent oxidoreductase (luciferase family)
VADGVFPIWMNPQRFDLLGPFIEEGLSRAGGDKTLADFDVAPLVSVVMGDNVDECRASVKAHLALYIGGMGPPGHNFYNDYAARMGYEAQARQIQELYLTGRKVEAAQAVPDQLVDDCALVGPAGRIRERLEPWKEAGRLGHVGSLLVGGASVDALRLLADELL